MVEAELLVPYAKQKLLGEVYDNARVVAEEYGEAGVAMRIRGLPAAVAGKLHAHLRCVIGRRTGVRAAGRAERHLSLRNAQSSPARPRDLRA